MPNKFQKGIVPPVVLFLITGILIAATLILKNIPVNQSQPTPDKGFQANPVVKSKQTPTPTQTNSENPNSPSPTSAPTSTPTSTPTPTPTSAVTSTPTPTPTSTPTPTPKTYTWYGTYVKAKTICDQNSQGVFNVQIWGSVTLQNPSNPSNGAWTTLTGNGNTIITSYQAGGGSPVGIAQNSFDGKMIGIRDGLMTLKITDNFGTYMYDFKIYEAPYTYGVPILANPIGSVSFGTDCR